MAKLGEGNDVSKEAAKLITPELFREEKIPLGRFTEPCQKPIEAFVDYGGEPGVPLHHCVEGREQDRLNMARFGL